jgi:uncharacterized protein YtpQ (UPF0354 family)
MSLFSWFATALGRSNADQPRFRDIGAFREHVMEILQKRPSISNVFPDANDPAIIHTMVDELEWHLDLSNIYGRLAAYPDENVDQVIARFLSMSDPANEKEVGEDNLVAVLRSKHYVDYVGQGGKEARYEPLVGHLMIVYMADLPDAMSPLLEDEMSEKSLSELRAIALGNVRKWLPKIVADDSLEIGSLYYVEDNTLLSTSLILLDEFWSSIERRFPHDVLIAVPRTDQLFLFDATKPNAAVAARAITNATIEDGFNLLSDKIYRRRNGQISVVDEQ